MDFGIFFLVAGIALLMLLPFALRGSQVQRESIALSRAEYEAAKKDGSPYRVIQAARTLSDEPGFTGPEREALYREVLGLIRKSAEYKPFALELGRRVYAAKRGGGSLTIYDEQALTNDIQAHSG